MKPKLAIGMATSQDFDGAYFTINALRLYHTEAVRECELIVIDQSPTGSQQSEMLANFVKNWVRGFAKITYRSMVEPAGTGPSRQQIFLEAEAPAVLCLDSHVLLPANAVRRLIDYYKAGADDGNLLHGPMLHDDFSSYSTHMEPVWREEMYGIWAVLWNCTCREFEFTVHDGGETSKSIARFQSVNDHRRFHRACPQCGREFPDIPFAGHEAELGNRGYRRFADDSRDEPREIPMHGMGLFSSRKAAWLAYGGFHPRFRGFGGEEGYIHQKYKNAGHKSICLPWLKWCHRFGRPAGVPYRLTRQDKVRNYILGWKELDRELDEIRNHFCEQLAQPLSQSEWDAILENVNNDDPWPPSVNSNSARPAEGNFKRCKLLTRFESVRTTPSDINEHCDTLRALASQCDHVTEFGMRHGVSTLALLAGSLNGQLKQVISYDINPTDAVRDVADLAPDVFAFRKGNSLDVDIEETDLLFIDTKHTGEQLQGELTKHAAKVRKWIAMHDSVTFGERGEDGGTGLLTALQQFLNDNPDWSVYKHFLHNHGLMVIRRNAANKRQQPLWFNRLCRLAIAVVKHIATGAGAASNVVQSRRREICLLCEHRDSTDCSIRCLPVTTLTSWAEQGCPVGKWLPTSAGGNG